ncbi:MAG: hypothetical protein VXV96_16155 [Bdellovibrionota bacterium]|nr:hypothetical protein [Bdellovibrionota bacterium]
MKILTVLILFFIHYGFYAQGSNPQSKIQFNYPSAKIDPDKRTIIFTRRSLNSAGTYDKTELSEEAKNVISSIAKSGEFNLVFRGYWGNHGEFEEVIHKYLDSIGEAGKAIYYDFVPKKDKPILVDIYKGDSAYVFDRDIKDLGIDYYHVIDKFHSSQGDISNFRHGGKNPLGNMLFAQRKVTEVGVEAFNEGFSFYEYGPKINYKKTPVECEFKFDNDKVRAFDLEVCLKNIDTTYSWINEKNKECGLFGLNKLIPLRKVNYLFCEPPHIQDFQRYLENNVIEFCEDAISCMDRFINDEVTSLVNSFYSLMIHERIQKERLELTKDEDHLYTKNIDKIIYDLKAFNASCENTFLQKWISDFFVNNPEYKDQYENLISKEHDIYVSNLSPLLSQEATKSLVDESYRGFIECIKNRVNSEATYSYEEALKECSYFRMIVTTEGLIKEYSNESGDYLEFKEFVEKKIDGICPIRSHSDHSDRINYRFESSFDAKRCFKAISEYRRDFDTRSLFSEDIKEYAKSIQNLSIDKMELLQAYKEHRKDCEIGSVGESECRSTSINKALAELVFYKMTKNGIEYDSEEDNFRRNSDAKDNFIWSVLKDEDFVHCMRSNSDCLKVASKYLDRERQGLFSRSAITIAQEALFDDLEGMVKEIDREISVFHWGTDDLSGFDKDAPVPLNSIRGYSYLKLRERMFHTGPLLDRIVPDPGTGTMAGRGLYAALDPNVTSDFGDTLFEIRIPKNSKFLDLREKRTEGKIPISTDTMRKLSTAGCIIDSRYIENYAQQERNSKNMNQVESVKEQYLTTNDGEVFLIDKALFEKYTECKTVFSAVIERLDINFLSYDYDSEMPYFCDETKDSAAAFVIVNTKLMGHTKQYNKASISRAIRRYEENGIPMPAEIERILQIGRHSLSISDDDEDSRNLASRRKAIEYWKDRIFQCNGLRKPDRVISNGEL